MKWALSVPLRDGVQLSGTLYLPKGQSEPSPCICTLTPYVAQFFHDRGMYFAARGYPFLAVDSRGRGNSQGEFRPFLQEAEDGHDTVEWLARQPFCNGKVAMWGGSYGGYVQWATSKELPPHLSTIVPAAAAFVGEDFPIRNNVASPYWMQWLILVAGRTSQDRMFWDARAFWGARFCEWFQSGTPFAHLDARLGHASPVFQGWLEHPHQDEYWDSHNPTADQYARISIPVLTITGSYDDDQPGALAHYREHLRAAPREVTENHHLVIGPWDHAGTRTPQPEFGGLRFGPASLVDLQDLHVQWYAWTMQGGPKPAFLQKRVAYYVMGAERWRYAESLEAATAHRCPHFLHSLINPVDVFASGCLTTGSPGTGGPDHYVYDPRDTAHASLESAVDPETLSDQRMIHAANGRQLVYHSAPFARELEITGFFKLSVWLAIDRPDTDFRVSIHEILPDGSSILLSFDTVRARYRQSLREPVLIDTRDPLRYDFERFTFVSRLIARGSRLRLVFGALNSIYSQKNYNSGGTVSEESMRSAVPVGVYLFHDADHPSVLEVPIGHPESSC